jgi:hypothetical protein
MGIQVVLHQTNTFGMRVVLVKQVMHELCIINNRASFSHFNRAKTRMGLKGKQDTARAMLFIFIMGPFGCAGTHGQYRSHITNEKTRTFVETEQRT